MTQAAIMTTAALALGFGAALAWPYVLIEGYEICADPDATTPRRHRFALILAAFVVTVCASLIVWDTAHAPPTSLDAAGRTPAV